MTSTLSNEDKERFKNEILGLTSVLKLTLEFQKQCLMSFNGKTLENYSKYFLDILARFRYNTETLVYLQIPFHKDYRLKISVNLILRSLCSDILTSLYLETFYDNDDPDNTALRNELNLISSEYLKFVKQTMVEDHDFLKTLDVPDVTSIDERNEWFKSLSDDLIAEDGNILTRNQIRESTNPELKKELKSSGAFLSENQKWQHIKSRGFEKFGFAFIAFKYYSQYQHFNLMSKKYIEFKPFHDTYYMALTIDQMLKTTEIIIQRCGIDRTEYGSTIDAIYEEIKKHFA
jgi:hypothetical protein